MGSTPADDLDEDSSMRLDDNDEPQDVDQDDDEGQEDDGQDDPSPSPPPERPRLKIKLRLPAHPSSASNPTSTPARTPAPDDASRPSSRRGESRDLDVESEDEDEDMEGRQSRSTPSTSVTGTSGRPMTTRQAVLASVVDSSHVSLFEPSRKKKPLNDAELALRREETARKRKNMSEKKLEDEKAETINRLLKKQSRPKNKRSGLGNTDDKSPYSYSHPSTSTNTKAASTPVPQSLLREALVHAAAEREAEEECGEVDGDGVGAEAVKEVIPTMYRWISSARNVRPCADDDGGGTERFMSLTFSVPVSVMRKMGDEDGMQVDRILDTPKSEARCGVDGCTQPRKYRLVKDTRRGACGMSHLKLLDVR